MELKIEGAGKWYKGDFWALREFSLVLFTHPDPVDPSVVGGYQPLHHVAMEVESRDEWLKALGDLRRKGVEIVAGPLVHGFEGGNGWGTNVNGSGSRSFYFEDSDGNSLESYSEMMKVPDGEPFPREEYEDLIRTVAAERAKAAAASRS